MYILLCGSPPFYGQTDQEVLARVKLGRPTFNPRDWMGVSENAKDLIRDLIEVDVNRRLTAEQALSHSWIKNRAPGATDVALPSNFVGKLRRFNCRDKFAKAALHVIASQLNDSQIKSLRENFLALDHNGDGLVSLVELKQGLAKAGLEKSTTGDLQEIMEGIDADGSGVIDYTEFLAATIDRMQYIQEDVCWTAFRVFDLNGDGKITAHELKTVLNNGDMDRVVQNIAEVLREVDKNGDGMIDFGEFMGMLRGGILRGMSSFADDVPAENVP